MKETEVLLLRSLSSQEQSCSRNRWLWKKKKKNVDLGVKKEAILFGIFFLPPFRGPDNSEEQQEQEGCARNVFGKPFFGSEELLFPKS